MKRSMKIIIILSIIAILVLLLILICNIIINKKSESFLYDNTNDIPQCKVGLLLGTSKLLKNGNENLYFLYRIDAAVDLYKSGKIQYIVASGDNNSIEDNEPLDMKNALLEQGIPDSVIYLDYAGFRTFDSVIRIHEIFGQSKYIIISQKFHNQRAIYIAQRKGMTAYGYNAQDVSAYYGFKKNIREKLARVKVFTDLLFNKQPKFLGETIEIGK